MPVCKFDTVAIVGVGLIGGSIGQALLARKLSANVIGIGRRQASLRVARRVGAVSTTTVDLAKGVANADLIIVCTPVGSIVDHVRRAAAAARPGTLITDAGSTKNEIAAALDADLPRGCRFLGSHPLAGSEKAGANFASADLFDGRVALITPTRNTLAEDYDALEGFWQSLGSVVIRMSPEEHDHALALTSHLPHALAAALVTAIPERLFRLCGSGMLDTSRVAGGDAELWTQIFLQNRENLLSSIEQLAARLVTLGAALKKNDSVAVHRFLAQAKKNRDALGS